MQQNNSNSSQDLRRQGFHRFQCKQLKDMNMVSFTVDRQRLRDSSQLPRRMKDERVPSGLLPSPSSLHLRIITITLPHTSSSLRYVHTSHCSSIISSFTQIRILSTTSCIRVVQRTITTALQTQQHDVVETVRTSDLESNTAARYNNWKQGIPLSNATTNIISIAEGALHQSIAPKMRE